MRVKDKPAVASVWFADCVTLSDLKRAYRDACIKNHPDMGGDVHVMQDINLAYEWHFNRLKDVNNANAKRYAATDGWNEDHSHRWVHLDELPTDYILAVLTCLRAPQTVTIDLCGEWLWAWGPGTYAYRQDLKTVGFRWSASKQKWYWRPNYAACGWSNGNSTYEGIKKKYGCTHIAGGRTDGQERSSSANPMTRR